MKIQPIHGLPSLKCTSKKPGGNAINVVNSGRSLLELSAKYLSAQLWNPLKNEACIFTLVLDPEIGRRESTDMGLHQRDERLGEYQTSLRLFHDKS